MPAWCARRAPAATLGGVDAAAVETMPGVVSVVRDGSFVAVVAEKEFQAVAAMRALASAARWNEPETLPEQADLPKCCAGWSAEVGTVAEAGSPQLSRGSVRSDFHAGPTDTWLDRPVMRRRADER